MSDSGHQLSLHEWNFASCPKEELEECWWYEFKREIPHQREIVINWRQNCTEQTFDEFFRHHRMLLMPPAPGHIYALCPEWPEEPYLNIPSAERSRRLKNFFSGETKSLADQLLLRPASRSLYDCILELEGKKEQPSARSLGDILPHIWHKSNQEIVSFVKAWFATHRPEKTKIDTTVRSLKTDLRALGALRILRVYAWNKGPPLYAEQGEWMKARARAEKIIERLSS